MPLVEKVASGVEVGAGNTTSPACVGLTTQTFPWILPVAEAGRTMATEMAAIANTRNTLRRSSRTSRFFIGFSPLVLDFCTLLYASLLGGPPNYPLSGVAGKVR